MGRANTGLGTSFSGMSRSIGGSFRSFNQSVAGGVRQAFFLQSAARQAANTVVSLGEAVLSPVSAARDFEDAFAAVTKTVDTLSTPGEGQTLFGSLTAEGQALRDELEQIASEIPVTFEELSELAGIGGQFGLIEGITDTDLRVEGLASFAETVAGLGEATNLSADNAGRFLAQISAINQVEDPGSNIRSLGAAIVELGNTTPTTEAAIGQLALRIAGTVNAIGGSQEEVLGLAAAFSGVGVRAEAGGTAISNVLLDIQAAASASESGLRDNDAAIAATQNDLQNLFADLVQLEAQTGVSGRALADSLAGLSGEELGRQLGDRGRERLFNTQREIDELNARLIRLQETNNEAFTAGSPVITEYVRLLNLAAAASDEIEPIDIAGFEALAAEEPVEVLTRLVEGLSQTEDAAASLEILGFNSVRTRDALLRVSGAADTVRDSIEKAENQFGIINGSVEGTDALSAELENRYSTLASQQEIFTNQIRLAAAEIGSQFLPIADRFLTIVGERIPDAIQAATTAFGPLATTLSTGLTAFFTEENFGARLDGILASIAAFDVTPITRGFEVLGNIFDFVSENFERISNLIIGGAGTLGLVASFVALGAAIAALTSPLGLIVTAGAVAFTAWQENWGGIQEIVQGVVEFARENQDTLLAIGAGIAGAATAFAAFTGLAATITAIGTAISGVGLVIGALTSPIGLVIAAGAALGVAWQQNFGNIQQITGFVVNYIIDSFTRIKTFVENLDLPNPFVDLFGGGEGETTGIRDLVAAFDEAFAIPEDTGDQSPAQQFIDGFLEPFRTIEIPEIDLSPITEAFTLLGETDALSRFADQFNGIATALERLNNSTGDGTLLRLFGEALGELIALRIENFARDINLLAAGIGAAGTFAATYAENIGAFFSAFVETPVQQVQGIVTALQGIGSIAGAETLGDLGSSLGTVAQGLLDIASAPIVNFTEVFTGTEITPPQLDFSAWGIQIAEAIQAIRDAFATVNIPLPEFSLGEVELVDTELAGQIAELFQGSILTATSEIREDFSNIFSDITFTAPDLSVLLDPFTAISTQIKALFSPAALFGDLLAVADADLTSLEGIREFVSSLFSDGESAGEDLDTGLGQGIEDNANIPVEAAKNMSERVINEGIYLPLAVRSPSEITRQAGADVVAGFALGLQDITAILDSLNLITTTIIESFTNLGLQLNEILGPGLLVVNEQFTLTTTNLQLLNEGSQIYIPTLQELTLAFQELGTTIQTAVIPPMTQLDQVQQLARDSARRLERAVKELAKAYKTLASALQAVKRAGGTTGAIPQSAGAAPGQATPAFASGGSFIVPGTIPAGLRGPTGGMLIEVHSGELVEIFSKAMTRQIQSVPNENLLGRTSVKEPTFSGAGITNAVNNTFNNQRDESKTELHLHVTKPVSENLTDNFDLMRSLARTR